MKSRTVKRQRPPQPPLFPQLVAAFVQTKGWTIDEAIEAAKSARKNRALGVGLSIVLAHLGEKIGCLGSDLRCDHDPALRTRKYNCRAKDVAARYTPHAHDPRCLVFRPQGVEFEGSHHTKTYIRGEHGQYSDTVLIKRERRRERAAASEKAAKPRRQKRKAKIASRPFSKQKRSWPKGRKLRSKNR